MLKSRIVFFFIMISLTVVYIAGCRRAGTWLVRDDKPEHGDAMMILMGGISDRVLQAADLYNAGMAKRLIIVEESMGAYRRLEERGVSIISNTVQARDAAVNLGIPADSITVLPGDARSTMTEAIIARDYLAGNSAIDTLILVTSAQHTRRASMIFRTALKDADRPVCVLCSPSPYTNFNSKHWWRDKEGIQTVLSEFVKIGNFLFLERKQLMN